MTSSNNTTTPAKQAPKTRTKASKEKVKQNKTVVKTVDKENAKQKTTKCASAPAMHRTINVADLFAAVPNTAEDRKRSRVKPVFTAGPPSLSPPLQSPVGKKMSAADLKKTLFGDMSAQRQRAQTTPQNKQRMTPPHVGMRTRASNSGCFATPAYADSPHAAELPLPPIHWLLDTPATGIPPVAAPRKTLSDPPMTASARA